MNDLKCPLCGKTCFIHKGVAYCGSHFVLDGNGAPLEVMLAQLAYCWEDLPLEEILDKQTKIMHDHLTYIKQVKKNWKIEAEGRLHNIIGLFGAFKRLV